MSGQAWSERVDDKHAAGRRAATQLIAAIGDVTWFDITQPDNPAGEWWLDIKVGNSLVNVPWRPNEGYGVYTSDEVIYGARPDEIYKDASQTARRILHLLGRIPGDKTRLNMRLSDIRRLAGKNQADVAASLSKHQSAISRFEGQEDAMLSTVRKYVEALGGKVQLTARFDTFEVPIEMPEAVDEQAPALRG